MLAFEAPGATRMIMLSFRRGEYLMEELGEFLAREAIDTALITSGIGSFDICKLHTITSASVPPTTKHMLLEGPVEIGSLQGTVAGGEPHIHVVVDDVARDTKYVGHLHAGSRCCFLIELGLIVLEGVKTERVTDSETQLVGVVPADD